MSFEFDWPSISEALTGKLRESIESIPLEANIMLASPIRITKLSLGNQPPKIALSHISTLQLDEQTIRGTFSYHGNAEFELLVDLNMNALGATKSLVEVNRFMGNIYCDPPMVTKCRFLVSAIKVDVEVEISHGETSYVKFHKPPQIELCIDSNLSSLKPIFDSALERVMKTVRTEFAKLPEKIEIPI